MALTKTKGLSYKMEMSKKKKDLLGRSVESKSARKKAMEEGRKKRRMYSK